MNERWFLDMDGTLAEWKVGCEAELLSEGYFRNLKPTEFVNPFREYAKEHPENVYILSHCLVEGYAYGDKQAWLDQYLPEIPKEHRLLLPCGVCKADYVIDVFHLEKLPEHGSCSMTIPKTCMPGRLLVVWGLSATTALTELTEHGNMVVSCGAANLQ